MAIQRGVGGVGLDNGQVDSSTKKGIVDSELLFEKPSEEASFRRWSV